MIDASKTTYKLILLTESGGQIDVTNAARKIHWEEMEDQLAAKISCTLYNAAIKGTQIGKLVKLNCKLLVQASWGSGSDIVAMGNIKEVLLESTKSDELFECVAYDNLYEMQRSQDDFYFEAGNSTAGIVSSVFGSWGISLAKYEGPNAVHDTVVYKNQFLGDIIRDIMKEGVEKGGSKGIVRCTKGTVSVEGLGKNPVVYKLESDSTVSSRHKISVCNLVTRVKVMSYEKEEGLPSVEAVVDGQTQYGIMQRIVTRASSSTYADTKAEAQAILNDSGSPEETSTVIAPDVPPMRKGDMVALDVGALTGNYIVKSISHDADSGQMTLQVEKWSGSIELGEEEQETYEEVKKDYKVGDIVTFHGGTHYVSSWPGAQGYQVRGSGPARIFLGPDCAGNGGAHPWHLITIDSSQCNVYGWVDEGTFS